MSEHSQKVIADASPERIATLSEKLRVSMDKAIEEIQTINLETRMLSFNARIEAARAGEAGAAFAIVGNSIQDLSNKTDLAAGNMSKETQVMLTELHDISQSLATNVRGTRLADIAFTNIDLIDRNLFERSCDVRWWASDASCVTATTERTPESARYASKRLAQILDSYTVYYDLVLCDLDGNVIANGRPDEYHSQGTNHSTAEWFTSAMATRTGEEYGFEGLHRSSLVNGKHVLVYSCAVRVDGAPNGAAIGVLGILFNWDSLAQVIVNDSPLSDDEKERTRVCIIDSTGLVLADTMNRQLEERIEFKERDDLLRESKSFIMTEVRSEGCCIAHAASHGFETYKTGWHSLIIQKSAENR